jgi:hypothetical protein
VLPDGAIRKLEEPTGREVKTSAFVDGWCRELLGAYLVPLYRFAGLIKTTHIPSRAPMENTALLFCD